MSRFNYLLKKIIGLNIPILVLVLILSIILQINISSLVKFVISSVMITLGITFYLYGYDLSYIKISDRICCSLVNKKNLIYILAVCMLLCFIITMFEPEILRVCNFNLRLLILIAFSISFFFLLSIYRILKKHSFKYYLIISYLFIFILLIKTDFNIVPFAFDRASLATGSITSPFLLTMGLAFSKRTKRPKKDSTSFGILALASIGPLLIFLILGIFFKLDIANYSHEFSIYKNLFYIFLSLIPLLLIYLIFLKFDIKKNKMEIKTVLKGLSLVIIGIFLFIIGGRFGYTEISYNLGIKLANCHIYVILIIAGILGFLITKIEPSFNFLMNYVNDVTNGGIKEKFLELFLASGVGLALIISCLIVKNNLNILEFLLPSFILAIILAFITPNRFLAIAFDSFGAVIGTISTSVFIPFLLGLAQVYNQDLTTVGLLAFIGIIPVIFLEIAGFIYEKEVILHDYNNLDDRIVDYG